jgi:uncharacterized damage-inducible protein DinB
MPVTKDQALDNLAQSRQALLAAIAGFSAAEQAQLPAEGVWTIKDLLAHVTSWENATLVPLRGFAASGAFQPEAISDHLAWNDQQAKRWQSLSLETIQQELHTTRQALLAEASKLADAQWEEALPAPWGGTGTLAQLLAGLAWHEMEHVHSIQKLSQHD